MPARARKERVRDGNGGVRAGALLLLLALGLGPCPALAWAPAAREAARLRTGVPVTVAAPRPRTDAFRVVAFGSSSTQGVGASAPAFAYPAQVEQLFNAAFRGHPAVTVLNRGVGGEDIDDMVRRLAPAVLSENPNLVIWQVGSNDPLRGVTLDHFQKALRGGVAAVRAAGAEVLLMEPQACPALAAADPSGRFVEAVRNVAAEQHVDVLRRTDLMHRWIAEGLATERNLVGPDGLHMTDRGYALLAKAVFDRVSASSPSFRGLVASAPAAKPL